MQPGSADPLPRAPRCIAQRVLHSSETQTGRASSFTVGEAPWCKAFEVTNGDVESGTR
jgi:hypothetical protein